MPPKLLVIESNAISNKFARKIKYAYSEVGTSWYEQIDNNNDNDVNNITENLIHLFDSIFVSDKIPLEMKNKIINKAVELGKELFLIPSVSNVVVMRYNVVNFDDTPLLRLESFRIGPMKSFIKRTFDLILSLIGLVIASPFMLICAIAIKLDSKGPIIYKQERLTIGERKFYVYKFRTMRTDAEKFGATFATENAPRITKVGKILRCLRLDELPQLFNIIKGDMSIVGPRPERPVFVEDFKSRLPDYGKRFFVKAGLTGYAQIYGKYDTYAADKIMYDLLYIRNFTFFLDFIDFKIILQTIKVIFIKESSAGLKEPVKLPGAGGEGHGGDGHEISNIEA